MKYKYGISEVEFEIMLKSQDNKCLICGLEFIEPCVDHCHKTGKITKNETQLPLLWRKD